MGYTPPTTTNGIPSITNIRVKKNFAGQANGINYCKFCNVPVRAISIFTVRVGVFERTARGPRDVCGTHNRRVYRRTLHVPINARDVRFFPSIFVIERLSPYVRPSIMARKGPNETFYGIFTLASVEHSTDKIRPIVDPIVAIQTTLTSARSGSKRRELNTT